ncbi:MAG: hypothetical protein H6682_13320 [Candidatus Eisenbacteria bacterium]|nr:hypothetical protein [Candidatus Eisenbacteria bacterium]
MLEVLRNGCVGRSCRQVADLVARSVRPILPSTAALFALLLPASAFSTTLLVPNEFGSIAEALVAASAGDSVLVSAGVYTEAMQTTPHGPSMIVMASDVVLRSVQGPEATILDAAGAGRCVYFGEVGPSTRLEGFTIQGGVALGTELYEDHGGGVFCFHSSPIVRDCVLLDNVAGIGGGMACDHPSTPTIHGCRFERNEALDGGGFAFLGSSAARLELCEFRENEAVRGGAVECHVSTPTIEGCTFERNHASSVGGAIHVFLGGPHVLGSTFWQDDAELGGTVRAESGSLVEILNCTVAASAVNGPSSSGAISLLDSFASIDGSIVAFTDSGSAVHCEGSSSGADVFCSDFYGNAGGDWVDCVAGAFGGGNIAEDPFFCSLGTGDLELDASSPCAGSGNGDCGQIGALPVGCDVSDVPMGAVSESTGGQWLSLSLAENPVQDRLRIQLDLAVPAEVRFEVVDPVGRVVSRFATATMPAGRSSVEWDVRSNEHRPLARGVYFLRARARGATSARSFVVGR